MTNVVFEAGRQEFWRCWDCGSFALLRMTEVVLRRSAGNLALLELQILRFAQDDKLF
jgi:hypothetical protein